jgi:hypothetical protein
MAIKRMNYFNGEFLKEDDFKIEQQYHVDMLRAHNRSLHSWGIANGLDIFKIGERKVKIKKGMAIDASGRQIIVEADIEERISDYITAPELYVTISYDEVDTDPIDDITGVGSLNTRTEEKHLIEFLNKTEFEKVSSSTPMKIFLARVILDNNKTISDIDSHGRKYAGTKTENYAIKFDSASGHKHTGRPDDGPVISHSDLNGVLPANTNSTDTAANKHVSDDLAKSWQDHISITSGNPHGTTAAQLSDYLANLFIIPTVLQFTDSDSNGATRKSRIGFVPKLALISGGFDVTLGKDIDGRKKEMYGNTFYGFWVSSGQAGCSSQHIKKEPHTDMLIYSSAETGCIFHIYVYYYDTSSNMTRPKAEILSGNISFSDPESITVTLNREVTSNCDPIDDFSISICVLCIS